MYGAVTGLATARAAPERRTYAYPRVPGNSWVGQSVLCLAWLWETQNQLCVALGLQGSVHLMPLFMITGVAYHEKRERSMDGI